jgi:small subunit ribosomal protein S4
MEKQFRKYYEEAVRKPGKTGENCCRSWRAGWTTSSTARAWPVPGGRLVSWSATALHGQRRQGEHPSYRVSQYDIIDAKRSR